MRRVKEKKGAIEMSLNLIILLIIGLTVLALVIGFVSGLINKGQSQFEGQLSAAEDREKKTVLDEPGFFAVGPQNLQIQAGGIKKLFIKINNLGTSNLVLPAMTGTFVTGGVISLEQQQIVGTGCTLEATAAPLTILPKDTQVWTLVIGAPKSTCSKDNEHFINVIFIPTGSTTIRKTITVNTLITS